MKHSVFAAAVATAIFTAAPASADSFTCAGVNMSFMTTMIDAMADGPSKWEMNRQLATINSATAADGKRGCDAAMMDFTSGRSRHADPRTLPFS